MDMRWAIVPAAVACAGLYLLSPGIGEEAGRAGRALPGAGPLAPALESGVHRRPGGTGTLMPAGAAGTETAGCLDRSEAAGAPAFVAEQRRLSGTGLLPDDLESYRSVDASMLEVLAWAGDSRAMMILGERHLLSAFGMDPARALDFLNPVGGLTPSVDSTEPDRSELEVAARWFYLSALHGRLVALWDYGETLAWQHGAEEAPVRLGWVSAKAWNELPAKERAMWNPASIYLDVVYQIAPGLRTGLSGFAYRMLVRSPGSAVLRDELVRRFLAEQSQRELPRIRVPHSTPGLGRLTARICDGVAGLASAADLVRGVQ